MSNTAVSIPGYLAGTWSSDPTHSEVSFTVRHMMVSKVRGKFEDFTATIVTAEDPTQSSVTAEVSLASIPTGNEQRDGPLKSADFFEAETHQVMTYKSTSVTADGSDWLIN